MHYRTTKLAAGVLAGLCLACSLHAQDASPSSAQTHDAPQDQPKDAKKDVKQLEAVSVTTSYQHSLSQALQTKREDTRVVDAISSEDIGKFPSENIAEAIEHIPGVQMQNINGRGSTISIRGLGPAYALTTVNGQTIKSADFTAGFRFDIIPPEIAASVQVIKSPTANMDAGGLSGTININTLKPLDLKDRKLIISGKEQRSDYRGGAPTPKAMLTYIDQFDDHKLGVFVNTGYQELKDRADYFWIDRWATRTDANGNSMQVPMRPRYRRFDRDTRRWVFNSGLQYRPTDSLEMGVNALYTRDRTDNRLSQQVFSLNGGTVSVLSEANGTATQVESKNFRLENNFQNEKHDWTNSLLTGYLNWNMDQWTLRTVANYTQGKTKESEAAAILGIDVPDAMLDLSHPGAVSFNVSDNLANAANYDASVLKRENYPDGAIRRVFNTEKSLQFDATRFINGAFISAIDMGVKYREETLDRKIWRRDEEALTDAQMALINWPSLASSGTLVSGFLNNSSAIQSSWISPNLSGFNAAVKNSGVGIPELFAPANSYSVTNNIAAAYVMADIDTNVFGMALRGNIGVRGESTHRTVDAYLAGPLAIDGDAGSVMGTTKTHYNYNNVLPSLNLVLDIRPDLLARFSAAQVLVRPILDSNTALSTTVDTSANTLGTNTTTVSIGQPTMKPLTANQADLGLEWYYTAASALTVDTFYKAIKNGTYQYTFCPSSYNGTSLSTNSGGDCVDSAGNLYDISETKNDSTISRIKGYEVGWTQSLDEWLPVKGFGLTANYTRVIPNYGSSGFKVRNLSKHTWNTTAFYEHHGFSARASLTHRSEFYQSQQDSFFAYAGHEVRALTQLDLMFGYAVNDKLSFSLSVFNANGSREQAYRGSTLIWQESSYIGRSVYAGFEWQLL
jgi:TonB-dependent receptor